MGVAVLSVQPYLAMVLAGWGAITIPYGAYRLLRYLFSNLRGQSLSGENSGSTLPLPLFREAIAHSANCLIICGARQDLPIIYASPGFESLTGYSTDEVVGHSYLSLEGNENQQISLDAIRQIVTTGTHGKALLHNHHKTGRAFWAEITLSPLKNSEGLVTHYVGTLVDISHYLETFKALQESESRYRHLYEKTPAMLHSLTPQGCIVSVSDHWLENLGYQKQEVIGQPLTAFVAEADKQQIDSILSTLQIDECCRDQSCQFIKKNGDRLDVLLSSIAKCEGESCTTQNSLGIIVDVTERKQAVKKLAQATTSAEAASKAKSEFLANMSHELRSPLNAILGFAQILRESYPSGKKRETLDIIYSSGEHLLALINDVLDMSKIEAGRVTLTRSEFDLYHLLNELQQMFRSAVSTKGLELVVERSPDLPRLVSSDRLKLKQILINLLSNAVKFTPTGSITLTAKKAIAPPSHPPEQETLASGLSSQKLTFSVSDTGVGISKAEQTQLFEAFVQTTSGLSACEGTGLGLAISHRYVQLLGGKIAVESALGQGTTFAFSINMLPVEDTRAQPQVPKGRIIGLAPGQPTYKVLVVDDVLLNRKLLAHLLDTVGFEVREAMNGREAIAQWQSWKPHLIWMDMHMPIMNGQDATRHIKILDTKRHTRVLALTASAFSENKTAALDSGCDDFASKPIQAEQIFEKMALHLGVRYQYEAATTPPTPQGLPSPALSPALLAQAPNR